MKGGLFQEPSTMKGLFQEPSTMKGCLFQEMMYLWWSLCTGCLLDCQVTFTTGESDLRCCVTCSARDVNRALLIALAW